MSPRCAALIGREFNDATVVVYHNWETSRHRLSALDAADVLTFTARAPWAFSAGQRYQIENFPPRWTNLANGSWPATAR